MLIDDRDNIYMCLGSLPSGLIASGTTLESLIFDLGFVALAVVIISFHGQKLL